MKVLLIQSYLGPSQTDGLVYPLGLAYLGTAVKANGHEVRLIDPNVLTSPLTDLQTEIRKFQPDFVGLSLRNIDSQNRSANLIYYYQYFYDTLDAVKDTVPDTIPLAVGGAGFSMFARTIMERNCRLDFGLTLEAEESLPELLDKLEQPDQVAGLYFRTSGGIKYTGDRPLPDFAGLPRPQRDFLDLQPYLRIPFSMGVQTKRGCALKCAYCNYPFLNGQRFRLRSVEDICDEVEYLAELGFRTFTFADSMLNIPPHHVKKLMQEMIERKLPVEWGTYMHIKQIDHDFLKLARRAGCVAMLFSPDGISQAAMDALQKNTTEKELADLVRLLASHREFAPMHVGFSLFINPPGETWPGLMKALVFYLKIHLMRLRRNAPRFRAYVGWIRLEPHTDAYALALEEGSITREVELLPESGSDLESTFYRHPRQGWLDPFLARGFRIEHWLSGLLKPLLRAVRRLKVSPK